MNSEFLRADKPDGAIRGVFIGCAIFCNIGVSNLISNFFGFLRPRIYFRFVLFRPLYVVFLEIAIKCRPRNAKILCALLNSVEPLYVILFNLFFGYIDFFAHTPHSFLPIIGSCPLYYRQKGKRKANIFRSVSHIVAKPIHRRVDARCIIIARKWIPNQLI